MNKTETMEIMYNSTWGGWQPSQKALNMYYERKKAEDSDFKIVCWADIERDDRVLIEIFRELGDEFDVDCSKTKIRTIDKKYEKYYRIENYDGNEDIVVEVERYHLDLVKTILQNERMTDTEKINEMKNGLNI
jgi:hypothetical protein